jgi:hypothetical protein
MVLRGLRIFGLVALRRRWRSSRCSGFGGANGVYIACMALVFLLGFFSLFLHIAVFCWGFFLWSYWLERTTCLLASTLLFVASSLSTGI